MPAAGAFSFAPSIVPADAVFVLELYAQSAPACRFAHLRRIGKTVHSLAVDWHLLSGIGPRFEACAVGIGSSHSHERFNLNKLVGAL